MFEKVLVPVDLSEEEFCEKTLKLALREVREHGAELHLLAVVPGYGNALVASYFSEEEHDKAVKKIAKQMKKFATKNLPEDITPVLKVSEGSAAESIIRYIKRQKIDLVLMRAHNRSKLDEFLLGSVSSRVAERAKCSVMLLKN